MPRSIAIHLYCVITLINLIIFVGDVFGHGMMMEPVGRASRWRFNSSAPKNYNDNELFCGGFTKQWNVNNGKCGLCGDDYSNPTPRPHEIGGKYGEGVIVRSYKSGNLIPVAVKLTAAHKGFFYFDICNLDQSHESEQCYNQNHLQLVNGDYKFYVRGGSGWYNITLQLPKGFVCRHCSLRWSYQAGNNWGICPNGTGAVGCGPQENFKSCADVSIANTFNVWDWNDSNDLNVEEEPIYESFDPLFGANFGDLVTVDDELEKELPLDDSSFVIKEDSWPMMDGDSFNNRNYATKEEILQQIKDLLILVLDEEQYQVVEQTLYKLGVDIK